MKLFYEYYFAHLTNSCNHQHKHLHIAYKILYKTDHVKWSVIHQVIEKVGKDILSMYVSACLLIGSKQLYVKTCKQVT